jgi:hypothetical protein
VSIREHTWRASTCGKDEVSLSEYVSIRQHSSAYVSIRQHTWRASTSRGSQPLGIRQHTSAYVSIRQHTAAHLAREHVRAVKEYVSLSELPAFSKEARKNDARLYDARRDLWLLHTPAYVSIRQHTSACPLSLRKRTRMMHDLIMPAGISGFCCFQV